MKQFIHLSKNNQIIYNSLQMAINLPINILIYGNNGLGKKIIINELFPNIEVFCAKDLEEKIINNNIDLLSYKTLVLHNINEVINKKEFFSKLNNIRIITSSNTNLDDFTNIFALKLHIKDLNENIEDFEYLKQKFIKEAKLLSNNNINTNSIKFDLSSNALSLKKSIFKSFFSSNLHLDDLCSLLENYLYIQLKKEKTYKELISIFEIPLLRASSKLHTSQVKMSKALDINRITLRKKLSMYNESL